MKQQKKQRKQLRRGYIHRQTHLAESHVSGIFSTFFCNNKSSIIRADKRREDTIHNIGVYLTDKTKTNYKFLFKIQPQ